MLVEMTQIKLILYSNHIKIIYLSKIFDVK